MVDTGDQPPSKLPIETQRERDVRQQLKQATATTDKLIAAAIILSILIAWVSATLFLNYAISQLLKTYTIDEDQLSNFHAVSNLSHI